MSSTFCDVAKEDFTQLIFLETSGHATNRSLLNFIVPLETILFHLPLP